MPVNYLVKGVVVDLRADTPKAGDRFYVDSNALYWTVYSKVQYSPNPPNRNQTQAYPPYLKRVLAMAGTLHWCGLSLSELAHLIEQTEYQIHIQATAALLKEKEFRHNLTAQRALVVQEIQTAWGAVESMASCVNVPELTAATTASALNDLAALPLDGYDLFTVGALRAAGITQVISDDGDFCTVPGITLFTANPNVISRAQSQNRFRRR